MNNTATQSVSKHEIASRYIYGIIQVSGEGSFTPIITESGEKVYCIHQDRFGCVVREGVQEDYLTMRKEALAGHLVHHQTTIEKVLGRYTVIPMKFGAFLKDEREVVAMLEKGEPLFRKLFPVVEGKIELDVAVSWHVLGPVLKKIGETNQEIIRFKREIAGNPPDDMFQASLQVGAMVKTALDEKREKLQKELIGRLSELSLKYQIHDLLEDKMIMNCAFLIPGHKEDEFDKLLNQVDEQYQGKIDFRCVGPLPPYSFATCEIRRVALKEIDRAKELLHLRERPSVADIKTAYREFVKREHPDQSRDLGAQKRFEEVQSAYQMLLDFCSNGEVAWSGKDHQDTLVVRRFNVAGTRIFNR